MYVLLYRHLDLVTCNNKFNAHLTLFYELFWNNFRHRYITKIVQVYLYTIFPKVNNLHTHCIIIQEINISKILLIKQILLKFCHFPLDVLSVWGSIFHFVLLSSPPICDHRSFSPCLFWSWKWFCEILLYLSLLMFSRLDWDYTFLTKIPQKRCCAL